jgi:hypothetical protein
VAWRKVGLGIDAGEGVLKVRTKEIRDGQERCREADKTILHAPL